MAGRWSKCTNPVFIAEHKNCKAIPKATVKDIYAYLKRLNKDV